MDFLEYFVIFENIFDFNFFRFSKIEGEFSIFRNKKHCLETIVDRKMATVERKLQGLFLDLVIKLFTSAFGGFVSPRPEAGIALNMRSRIFMFLDVRRTRRYDHESHASNIQKAHILANRIIFILKEGLNMTEEHPKKTATKIFGHIWMSIQLHQNCYFG